MIAYQDFLGGVKVSLDGKPVGVIQAHGAGFRYQPNKSALAGEELPTIAAVKRSLEQ